jgi:hypothetical protein
MKKIILLILLSCLSNVRIYSQDLLIKKNGEEIPSKVLEITLFEIKYRKLENLNGPIYTILINDVKSIIYKNGTKDNFQDQKINKIDTLSSSKIPVIDSVKINKNRQGVRLNMSIGFSNIESKIKPNYQNDEYPTLSQNSFSLGLGANFKLNDRIDFFISNSLYLGRNLYNSTILDINGGMLFKLFNEKPKSLFFFPDLITIGPTYNYIFQNSNYYGLGSNYFKGYLDFQTNTFGYNVGLRYKFPLKYSNIYTAFSYTNQPIANSSYSYEFKNFTIFIENKSGFRKVKKINTVWKKTSESSNK